MDGPTRRRQDRPDALYSGASGIILALLEGDRDGLGDGRWDSAALRGAHGVVSQVDSWADSSLYLGVAGMAFALHAVGTTFDDPTCLSAARHGVGLVDARVDGRSWGPMSELLGGNAGIGLAALAVGDVELAVWAVEPYATTADRTSAGVNWAVRPSPPRSHHVAHGTLGIVTALALVGAAAGRRDLVALAETGAADVVARNEAGPEGFLVRHSDPPHRPELVDRWSYGWCNGPAGDAQAFRSLHAATADPVWLDRADRCWHSVTSSGLPARVRPGFWDNNGRCCGTAGVLALGTDRVAEGRSDEGFTRVLVDDLVARADIDGAGVHWSNVEHRQRPSRLSPRTGWAMGAAGIVRELLRWRRLERGGSLDHAVSWPDQLPPLRAA